MENKQDIAVSILCVTYNHKNFIAKALDGFLMQKTNFPYEIVVHDDASTDGTREILLQYQEKYPDKIRLILQEENQYSKGVEIFARFLLPEIRGKYAAICDGDDEWIYDGKLQEQYDFMENHPEVSMCQHNAIRRNFETDEESIEITGMEEGYVEEREVFLSTKGHIPTASYFFRGKYVIDYPDFNLEAPVGDDPLRFHCAYNGQIYYMDKVWAVRNFMHEKTWNYNMKSKSFRTLHTRRYLRYLYEFNQYSEGRFEQMIEMQIYSMCQVLLDTMLPSKYTLQLLHENVQKADKDTKYLFAKELQDITVVKEREAEDYVEGVLKKFVQKCSDEAGKLYIYGAGLEAQKCAKILERNQIDFEGFVVTNKHNREDVYLGYTVYVLDDSLEKSEKVYFLLGLNIYHRKEVSQLLRERGHKHFI